MIKSFDFQPRTRVVFGPGAIERLGELAAEAGFRRSLLVSDRGLLASGHVAEALEPLRRAGVEVHGFHDFDSEPDTNTIERGLRFVAPLAVDSIIGLGGGSSLDCAKGINFLLTNGGEMRDYLGYGKAAKPLLPMIGVPTTAGTGSESQSFALIADANSHRKMACGDPKASFRLALLDPVLTLSQPTSVTATSGFDAVTHAVETFVTTKRNIISELFSREAWRLLEANYEKVLASPDDLDARGAMQLGSYFAGAAIENSMLGATHACANPLTARYGTIHGAALAMLLPTVVRWNSTAVEDRYAELVSSASARTNGAGASASNRLAGRLEQLANAGGLSASLRSSGVANSDLPSLADDAATQWTGGFNPRPFDRAGAMEIYQRAYEG